MRGILKTRSLSGRALAFIVPAAVLIFGLSTWFAYSNAQEREIESSLAFLREDATQIRSEMQFRFDEIETAHDKAISNFEIHLKSPGGLDFNAHFLPHGDGTLRSSDSLWEGEFTARGYASGFGAYISDVEVSSQRQEDLVAALSTLIGVSAGLPQNVSNIYFYTITNDLVMFAPQRPDKLLFYRDVAPASLDFREEEFTKIIQPDVNPEGEMRCTSLQPILYDQTGRTWTSGCMTPVRIDGRQLGGMGSSIPLDKLIGDEESVSGAGVERILVTADMMLVRHPKFTQQASRDTESFLDLSAATDPELKALAAVLKTTVEGSKATYLEDADKYIYANRLSNPNWFVISALPGETVRANALASALPVLLTGILATILFVVLAVLFVQRQIARPLGQLTAQADSIFTSAKDGDRRPVDDLNEVDLLNHAMEEMRARVDREHSRVVRSYDAVLDTLDDFAVFIAGPGGRVIQASRGAHRIFQEDVLPGASLGRYLGVDDGESLNHLLSTAIQSGEVIQVEERERGDGTKFWVNSALRPLRSGGTVIGFALILRDSTKDKESELELLSARDDAEFEAETRKSLLATVSHEIRTPMTGILGMLEQVKEDNSARSRDRALTVIEGAVDALMRVLDDVLENARAESGKMTIEEREFESNELIRRIFELFSPLAKRKGVKLELEPGPREILIGDPARIQQIVANFLSNAIKFTSDGKVDLVCEAREHTKEAVTLAISVKDEGIGISEEEIQKLFHPFEQANDKTKGKFGGTGLGLYICKELAEAMGGEIEVESEPQVGSKFTLVVKLPRALEMNNELPGTAKTALVVGGAAMSRLTSEAALEELGFRARSVGRLEELDGDSVFDLLVMHSDEEAPGQFSAPGGHVLWVGDGSGAPSEASPIAAPVTADKIRNWLVENAS